MAVTEAEIKYIYKDCPIVKVIIVENTQEESAKKAVVEFATLVDENRARYSDKRFLGGREVVVTKIWKYDDVEPKEYQPDPFTLFYEIIPKGNTYDIQEVLEDCKDVELDGIFWEKETIGITDDFDHKGKSNVILGATVVNGDVHPGYARFILRELWKVESVDKVIDVTEFHKPKYYVYMRGLPWDAG